VAVTENTTDSLLVIRWVNAMRNINAFRSVLGGTAARSPVARRQRLRRSDSGATFGLLHA
jgi:hypothetical protein